MAMHSQGTQPGMDHPDLGGGWYHTGGRGEKGGQRHRRGTSWSRPTRAGTIRMLDAAEGQSVFGGRNKGVDNVVIKRKIAAS